jgi:hypothetical protein
VSLRPPGRLATVVVVVTVSAATGVAAASIPSRSGVITACYAKKDGTLRVIDAARAACKSRDESRLLWNERGVPGAPGANGHDGAAGRDGVSGYEIATKVVFTIPVSSSGGGGGSVSCPAGKKALGGGGSFIGPNQTGDATGFIVTSSYPKADGSGWLIGFTWDNRVGVAMTVTAYAICAGMSS